MKKINNKWYTDKQYIELLEKRISRALEKSEHHSHICLSNRKYKEFELFNEISKTLKGEENENN